jgi:hypothetical protein
MSPREALETVVSSLGFARVFERSPHRRQQDHGNSLLAFGRPSTMFLILKYTHESLYSKSLAFAVADCVSGVGFPHAEA